MKNNKKVYNFIIGTKNNAKLKAVQDALNRMNLSYNIKSVSAESDVSDMPLSDSEILKGAKNRAKNAFLSEIKNFVPDYSFGIEGGIIKFAGEYYVKGWVSVYNGKTYSNAACVSLPFPEKFGEKIFSHKIELGPYIDSLSGNHKINHKQGTVGLMTNNVLTRSGVFSDAAVAALMFFFNKYFYNELAGKI